MTWRELSDWWRSEVDSDPAYESVVTPLLLDVLQPASASMYLDIGCGEGRVMRAMSALGAGVHGVDLNPDLMVHVPGAIAGDALQLPIVSSAYDGVYSVLTLDHIEDHIGFFREAARVTKPGGVMALVANHPIWTAPDSTPITDEDGEVLWRPGDYFSRGTSEVTAGDSTVTFYHRSISDLLNSAADAGWSFEQMVELPHHDMEDQAGIPRLLACRWRLGASDRDR